ncbi:MarR family transcriptional regulator [Kutzneria sp. NPDC051319]|uniref:MarR family winged helix-turn-helix transcriptional regulator n=1 Tax=Kutzneria sp. NPDC051319 TaxID=3155047 RepID=UPI003448A5F8
MSTGRAEPTLLYVMKQVELAVRAQLDGLLRPSGITALQYTALTVLERRTDMSSAELARNSFVTTQTMADMVAALLDRGLISRCRDQTNRRRLKLRLTAAGRELLDRHRHDVADLETRMLSRLTPQQAAHLRDYMYECRAALTDTPPH